MGNAVKDTVRLRFAMVTNQLTKLQGRSWEALQYYRRAVEQNPDLPEAVCGLMSSMAAVCDWRGRDSLTGEWGVDDTGNIIYTDSPATGRYMRKMVDICETQLRVAYAQNIHAVSATKGLADWIDSVQVACGRPLREEELERWRVLLGQFYATVDRTARNFNEGGFLIRMITWLQPRLQRQWYVKCYGKALLWSQVVAAVVADQGEFRRPTLPRTMSPPVVPSILPFNTVRA